MSKVLELQYTSGQDFELAAEIAKKYDSWKFARASKEASWRELSNYIFATDTSTTSNSQLPWKNKTTTPKLTQIRDNLHANYMAALFPHKDWLQWIGDNRVSNSREKRQIITAFMEKVLRDADFEDIVSQLLYDWIDYGNCFAGVNYKKDTDINSNGEYAPTHVGSKLYRISPYDIVFDPTAVSFDDSPKITRMLRSVGELILEAESNASDPWMAEALNWLLQARQEIRTGIATKQFTEHQLGKNVRFSYDGFGSISNYINSGLAEILEFEGDLYNPETGEMYINHRIVVIDRSYVVYKDKFDSWSSESYKKHSAWRKRTDNLWGMGPLDNLVGMQYRLDHLENLKADILDALVHPIAVLQGDITWDGYSPGAEVLVGPDGNFNLLRPDASALQANLELERIEAKMEELAGAPKDAMGIRTPGEKTKFEVSQLQNAASRLFQAKLKQFEEQILEPLVNLIFELEVKYFTDKLSIMIEDVNLQVDTFIDITKQDVIGTGRLRPVGAKHFARQAQLVQDMSNMLSVLNSDPSVAVHVSGVKTAQVMEELLGFEKYGLVKPNIRITEQLETERARMVAQERIAMEAQEPTELTEEDINGQVGPI